MKWFFTKNMLNINLKLKLLKFYNKKIKYIKKINFL